MPCPIFSKRPNNPWEEYDDHDARNSDAHMDILDLIGAWGGGSKPSLHEFAVACGILGKMDVHGSEVADLYLDGRMDESAASFFWSRRRRQQCCRSAAIVLDAQDSLRSPPIEGKA